MKYAICMLVHQKPTLLEKIVERLKNKNTEIYIHLDKKCKLSDFLYIRNVTFIKKRIKVYWGGRSMVRAMYYLIEYVVKNSDCDYLLFISGEDFPVVLPERYDEYIDANKNYMEYNKLPKRDWYLGGLNRIKHYYIFRYPKSLCSKIFIKIQKILGIERKVKFEVYGGSQWININKNTAEYILKKMKFYYPFFKFCYIPDEMIFQTIVMNSELKDSVVNKNYRYLRYEKTSSNAAYLNSEEIDNAVKFKYLFCRKIKDIKLFDSLS